MQVGKKMKNFIYLLMVIFSFADAAEERKELPRHRGYLGPDIFFDHMHVQYHSINSDVSASSNAIFGGLRIGYDYLAPQTFYFGTNGLIAIGTSSVKENSTYYWDYYGFYNIHTEHKTSPLFTNIEQRYGYSFQSPVSIQSIIAPFAGIGWYYTKSTWDQKHSFAYWFYGAVGLRISQQFYKYFDIGCNLKAMYTFAGQLCVEKESNTFKEPVKKTWGYEIALPLTWYIDISKKWDIQCEPYLLKLDVNTRNEILGIRLLAGYNF